MSAVLLIGILSRLFCGVPFVPPANDECAGAIAITGEGEFSFSNTEATTSGIITECDDFPRFGDPNFSADVWYCWTAGCTGVVTVDTCGSSAADTKIGIYEGCGCSAEAFLTCSDNDCTTQSKVEFSASAGATYGIRMGSAPGVSGPADSFHIACRAYESNLGYCGYFRNPATFTSICKARSNWDALSSTRGDYTIVENFVPERSGLINTVCWAGTYLNNGQECIRYSSDEFEITYYADDCGSPGAIIAGPFPSHHESLEVAGPAMTQFEFLNGAQEFEYRAEHGPLEVMEGQSYWIGITNSAEGDCSWYWETSPGNLGYAVQMDESNNSTAIVQNHLSLCFDVRHEDAPFCTTATVPNDTCETATPLFPGTVEFDTMGATTEGSFFIVPQVSERDSNPIVYNDDFPLGDYRSHKDIWFELHYPCSGKARISVCNSSFDTKLAAYQTFDCPPPIDRIAQSDDDCGFENLRSVVEFVVSDFQAYKLHVSGYDGAWGVGELQFHYVPPDSPTLRNFAALSRCFTASCTPFCGPLPMDCCEIHDFDIDSDVDLNDAHDLLEALTGPE